jgi:uracil-DNA glycosylase
MPTDDTTELAELSRRLRRCRHCEGELAAGPRPIFQLHPEARILIASQAPGSIAHASGVPFEDPSGRRLRAWMGLDRDTFYDARQVAILPMAACYPGKGRGGDLPPPADCARLWRKQVLAQLPALRLTLAIGRHAQQWHLHTGDEPLSDVVARWREFLPHYFPLPHPSPRNNVWLSRHAWFEDEVVPALQSRVSDCL